MNVYYFRARLFPAVLTSIPIFVLVHSIILKNYKEELIPILPILPILSSMGVSFALMFILIQINRVLSKEIFQRFYFKDELNMPTTNFLMWKDEFYDDSIKLKIQQKIQSMYNIELYSKIDEIQNEDSARKRVAIAVSQIRNGLRGNDMLFQHNVEYGFFRNLIGGCVIAVILSSLIFFIAYSHGDMSLQNIGLVLFVIYLIPLLLSKKILRIFGNNYAKILFEQFLSISTI
ncbi:MAG TPA: hypothetical protein DF610_03275 [Sphingobacterium sp.]|nr:hypothetical protein [Sphingobacterium sp.]